MPKPPRPKDINLLASRLVAEATGQVEAVDDGKDPAAVSLGRRGGLVGGKARAKAFTKRELSAMARKAARARWGR